MEFLTLFVDSVAMEKGATCITSDILNRVAMDGPREVTQTLKDYGMSSMCEVVKGAALATDDVKAMSAAVIHKSARLGPVVAAVAAAELFDMLPHVTRMCDRSDVDQMDKLAGLGALMQMNWNRPQIEKAAASLGEGHPLLQALMAVLSGAPKSEQVVTGAPAATVEEADDRDAALTSDVSGSMGEDNEGDDHKASTM
jgi:hypothetical protein